MDKKILIALGLISAFSIDNATGMEGIIENPSVNESQSMKTINDFSDDLRSLKPIRKLFNLTNLSQQKWQETLRYVSEMVDFYWTHPDVDMTVCLNTYCSLFIYHKTIMRFIETSECDSSYLQTLTTIFKLATRAVPDYALTDVVVDNYSVFLGNIDNYGLKEVMLNTNYYDVVLPLADVMGRTFYGDQEP